VLSEEHSRGFHPRRKVLFCVIVCLSRWIENDTSLLAACCLLNMLLCTGGVCKLDVLLGEWISELDFVRKTSLPPLALNSEGFTWCPLRRCGQIFCLEATFWRIERQWRGFDVEQPSLNHFSPSFSFSFFQAPLHRPPRFQPPHPLLAHLLPSNQWDPLGRRPSPLPRSPLMPSVISCPSTPSRSPKPSLKSSSTPSQGARVKDSPSFTPLQHLIVLPPHSQRIPLPLAGTLISLRQETSHPLSTLPPSLPRAPVEMVTATVDCAHLKDISFCFSFFLSFSSFSKNQWTSSLIFWAPQPPSLSQSPLLPLLPLPPPLLLEPPMTGILTPLIPSSPLRSPLPQSPSASPRHLLTRSTFLSLTPQRPNHSLFSLKQFGHRRDNHFPFLIASPPSSRQASQTTNMITMTMK